MEESNQVFINIHNDADERTKTEFFFVWNRLQSKSITKDDFREDHHLHKFTHKNGRLSNDRKRNVPRKAKHVVMIWPQNKLVRSMNSVFQVNVFSAGVSKKNDKPMKSKPILIQAEKKTIKGKMIKWNETQLSFLVPALDLPIATRFAESYRWERKQKLQFFFIETNYC